MTQPDRRHLRRARLAPCRRGRRRSGRLAVVPWRAYLLQQSLTALASLDPQQVRGFIAAWGRRPRWSHLR